jgi:hypothetical protein
MRRYVAPIVTGEVSLRSRSDGGSRRRERRDVLAPSTGGLRRKTIAETIASLLGLLS